MFTGSCLCGGVQFRVDAEPEPIHPNGPARPPRSQSRQFPARSLLHRSMAWTIVASLSDARGANRSPPGSGIHPRRLATA